METDSVSEAVQNARQWTELRNAAILSMLAHCLVSQSDSNMIHATFCVQFGDVDMQMESENEELQRRSSSGGIGDKYLMARRHTVGPGDTAHEQVSSDHFSAVEHSGSS
jgi:hypothetical protein